MTTSKASPKFKKRYVLGVGYPGIGRDGVSLYTGNGKEKYLFQEFARDCQRFDDDQRKDSDWPRYRLVLERIDKKRDKGERK